MHTSKVLVKTGQGKVLSSSWQTKGWQWNEDTLTDQFHTSLFGVLNNTHMCPFLIHERFLELVAHIVIILVTGINSHILQD